MGLGNMDFGLVFQVYKGYRDRLLGLIITYSCGWLRVRGLKVMCARH